MSRSAERRRRASSGESRHLWREATPQTTAARTRRGPAAAGPGAPPDGASACRMNGTSLSVSSPGRLSEHPGFRLRRVRAQFAASLKLVPFVFRADAQVQAAPTGAEQEMQSGSERSLVREEQLRFASPPEVDSPARGSASLKAFQHGSNEVEAVQIHHLVPRRHEVAHKLLLRVVAGIDFRDGSELRVRAEDEVDGACRST